MIPKNLVWLWITEDVSVLLGDYTDSLESDIELCKFTSSIPFLQLKYKVCVSSWLSLVYYSDDDTKISCFPKAPCLCYTSLSLECGFSTIFSTWWKLPINYYTHKIIFSYQNVDGD